MHTEPSSTGLQVIANATLELSSDVAPGSISKQRFVNSTLMYQATECNRRGGTDVDASETCQKRANKVRHQRALICACKANDVIHKFAVWSKHAGMPCIFSLKLQTSMSLLLLNMWIEYHNPELVLCKL